jgi:hypothetical protein
MDGFPCQNKTLEGTWDHRERLSYVALEMLFGIFINYSQWPNGLYMERLYSVLASRVKLRSSTNGNLSLSIILIYIGQN